MMSPRLPNMTVWYWCFLVLYPAVLWNPVESGSVQNPPKNYPGIEAQAKFFQDFFSVQLSPYKIEFGHVCEDPNTWEQRYERKDFKNHRDMGKVRWGDKEGGYGEHYWDLNHAGHSDDNGDHGYGSENDYNHNHADDSYDEPSDNSPQFESDESEKYEVDPKYDIDDGNRNKRAHVRLSHRRKAPKKIVHTEEENDDIADKEKEQKETDRKEIVVTEAQAEEEDTYERKPKPKYKKKIVYTKIPESAEEEEESVTEKQVVSNSQVQPEPQQYQAYRSHEQQKYLPYEQGSGVRQHHETELAVAASIPRLFWEPSTGRVVDRATGQAYILQPIAYQHQ